MEIGFTNHFRDLLTSTHDNTKEQSLFISDIETLLHVFGQPHDLSSCTSAQKLRTIDVPNLLYVKPRSARYMTTVLIITTVPLTLFLSCLLLLPPLFASHHTTTIFTSPLLALDLCS